MDLIILTDYRNYIPQIVNDRQSLDIDKLKTFFRGKGWNVKSKKYHNVNLKKEHYKNKKIMYASSQAYEYKRYIQDILYVIKKRGGELIPNFGLFLAHEDKLMQSLLVDGRDINYPKTYPIGTFEEGVETLKSISYPIVAKNAKGDSSNKVCEINNIQEGKKFLERNLSRDYSFQKGSIIKKIYRQIRYGKRYSKGVGRVILQEKIEDVSHDWKVLVFGNKLFTLKRFTRENDFRASGSGKFSFEEDPPKKVLDCALRTREIIDSPWLSVDIIDTGQRCFVVEFQAVHFGMVTFVDSQHFYHKDNGKWLKKEKGQMSLEVVMSEAFMRFVQS
ncbi:MAG: hypothetical protein ABEI13_04150 [Candidatus Paceibacteria bacterium]